MRLRHHALPVFLLAVAMGVPSTGWAQTAHIAGASAQQAAMDKKNVSDDRDRADVVHVLASPEAQALANRLGLSLTSARSAVMTMSGTELTALADTARTADAGLSGGANTIVISTTTLLLVLIIVILLVR